MEKQTADEEVIDMCEKCGGEKELWRKENSICDKCFRLGDDEDFTREQDNEDK